MPRSQGFARGDIDTAFPLDDKFLALRGRMSGERYYSATGVYFHVVAATWREAERKIAIRIVPDAADLIDDLIAVGLLDPDGRVPPRAFTNHIGRARRQRKASTDRQARKRAVQSVQTDRDEKSAPSTTPRNRAGMSREVTRDSGVTARDTAPLRSVGTEGTDGSDEGGAGGNEPDAAVSLHVRTGRFPSPNVLGWLDDLIREAGAGDTEAGERRLAALIDDTPMGAAKNVKEYLHAVSDKMRQSNREATRHELADEAERVAAKRQPVRLVPAPDNTTPEEAERLAAAWEAEYGRKPA